MQIDRVTIANQKSFFGSTEFQFQPGFNILLGANSSGKTTVLEALDPSVGLTPHRSMLSHTTVGLVVDTPAEVTTRFELSAEELKLFSARPDDYVGNTHEDGQPVVRTNVQILSTFLNRPLQYEIARNSTSGDRLRLHLWNEPCAWQRQSAAPEHLCARIERRSPNTVTQNTRGDQQVQWQEIRLNLQSKIYRFATERRPASASGHVGTTELAADGASLPYCINHLQTQNQEVHAELVRLTNRVLPAVKSVNAVPDGGNMFQLMVHSVAPAQRRGDLAVSLASVGTGVGNVVAILYVALASQTPRIILLEEPNSYLHPRALRELLAILADVGAQHQFFITTHSSDVLRTVKASTVTQLEYDGQQTTRKQVPGAKLGELKAGLMDIGIRISDLHGCDRVLWVEGQTEEAVFPLLLRKYFPDIASGTAVLCVHATSDFDGGVNEHHLDPVKVGQIYQKLSDGNALAPLMVGIVLDRETRQKSECEKITKDSTGDIHFLERPMLEDYFLHPIAIARLIQERSGIVVDELAIERKLKDAAEVKTLWLNPKAVKSKLHAAAVLNYVCTQLTDNVLEYRKTRDGPWLVDFLLKFDENALSELKALLHRILD
jgi:energy-coupling factor transporter ATP-binding protein EcfA2